MDVFQVSGVKRGSNEIEETSETLNTLVLSSKRGDWNTVWSIIGTPEAPTKSYLLNAIPQNRRWGVLHQAVYWNRPEILKTLLNFPTCDPEIKAKKCLSECGPTDGLMATEIAKKYGHNEMEELLKSHSDNTIWSQTIPTFQSFDGYCDDKGLYLLSLTLAAYKKAFHPSTINPQKSIMDVMSDVYRDIVSNDDRWREIKEVVADAVFPVSAEKANDISRCESRDDFFSQVIRTYTNEDNSIYKYLNIAFRRQKQCEYMPGADDLAMGPYCVMYQMLLLFWDDLEVEHQPTYRKMKMCREDVDEYVVGVRFVWQSIVSSAVNRQHTHSFPAMRPNGDIKVMFTIDNSSTSKWKPRNIEQHADFPETERTYPAGAKFQVTSRLEDEDMVSIGLKLI